MISEKIPYKKNPINNSINLMPSKDNDEVSLSVYHKRTSSLFV